MQANNVFVMEIWCIFEQNLKSAHVIQVTPPKQKNLTDALLHHTKSTKATNYSSSYFTATLSKITFQNNCGEK